MTLVHRSRQSGFSLIVALMMLIVIIILGISGSQMAINEERGARNDRDRQVAFQAAEAALKDAEFEILNIASPPCPTGQFGHARFGTTTCFDERSKLGFVLGCSTAPNEGLCDFDQANPAYLNPLVDFYADAKGSGPPPRTTAYGAHTAHSYPTSSSSTYPPRYIIELVPKNIALDSCPDVGSCKHMFRVTAMGFGANPNSQVVLQTIISTPAL